MSVIKKILFPVDFSARCAGAARYVASYAGWFDAEVMLLHVVDMGPYALAARDLEPSRRDKLSGFLADELEYLATRRVCTVGDPAQEIAALVASWRPDLVMMPSYGLGSYRPSLLGSVTGKVLHDVDCPVWTGIHTDQAPALEDIACRKVLCAVDLGPRTARVIEWAASLAAQHEAEFGIVHATPAVSVSLASPLSQKLADTLAAEAKRKILELEPEGCVRGPVMIDSGDPAKVVACAAKEFHADLLVIGRHGGIHDGSGEEGYLRHNAYAVIRGAPCPVISI